MNDSVLVLQVWTLYLALEPDRFQAPGAAAGTHCRGVREPLQAEWQMIQAPRGSSCHGSTLDSVLTHLGGSDG